MNTGSETRAQTDIYLSAKKKHRDYSADKLKNLPLQMPVNVFVNRGRFFAVNKTTRCPWASQELNSVFN